MSNVTENQIREIEIGSQIDWKFGLITRSIYRVNQDKFEINETCETWLTSSVNLDTMIKLVKGEMSFFEIDWN